MALGTGSNELFGIRPPILLARMDGTVGGPRGLMRCEYRTFIAIFRRHPMWFAKPIAAAFGRYRSWRLVRRAAAVVLGLLLTAPGVAAAARSDATVPGYHAGADRSGSYIVPGLTWRQAAQIHRDRAHFAGAVIGQVYAEPLYWRPPGSGRRMVIVATEDNVVYGLDPTGGRPFWLRGLGRPVPRSLLPCGNIDPVGVTGTPVIDPHSGTLYLDAMIDDRGTPHHRAFAMRLSDGAVAPGWPVDVELALRARGIVFSSGLQSQRGALALMDDRLYVPFGGNFGDCGDYHGVVLGIRTDPPQAFGAWATRAPKGGIWAPGGVVSDGRRLFVATGNTDAGREWGDGEAVIHLPADLQHSSDPRDFFAPPDWRALDAAHAELGGANPLPIDLPGAPPLILQLGKDGNAYLLDRANLGGFGGALAVRRVAGGSIIAAPAAYPIEGGMVVAFRARAAFCPSGGTGGLAALVITAIPQPGMRIAWCAPFDSEGARPIPIVTTTDGRANPIVWIVGAGGDNRLHGFRGDTGQVLFAGGGADDRMEGLPHFATILPADGTFYIPGDGRLYAFRFGER
jgi:hypothetical protein